MVHGGTIGILGHGWGFIIGISSVNVEMASLGPWMGRSRGGGGGAGSDPWDPFEFGSSSSGRDDPSALANAHVDWRETDTSHIFRADIPGVRKEEVKVHVEDGNILQISGERTKEEEQDTDTWHRVERRHGVFTRRFRLPENADVHGAVTSDLTNGVLTITVPKKTLSPQYTSRNVRYIDLA